MLSIDRKIEQSIYIGSSELKVLEIKERSVMFSFAGKQYRIPSGHSLQLERTEVFLFSVFSDKEERHDKKYKKMINKLVKTGEHDVINR